MTPGPALSKTPLPKGFHCNSINCGVRKYRPDLGVVISDYDCVAVGLFTQNESKAAPVRYCEGLLPSKKIRAIITNSGQANAATGEEGERNNQMLVQKTASSYGLKVENVLIASTGIIGVQLDIEKLVAGLDQLKLRSSESAESFATAIMTTDLIPKTVHKDIELSNGTVRLTGVCKGSGMIHPNMATMLGYVFTDAKMNETDAKELFTRAVNDSFNMISVDGETSTNDSTFMLANGASGVEVMTDDDLKKFEFALKDICIFMAKSIAADGEGATKLIEVTVKGLDDIDLAKKAARGITTSPLIKTAIHGEDPNWGRIYSRLGQFGITSELMNKVNLSIQGVDIVETGKTSSIDYYKMKTRFKEDTVRIDIDFQSGKHLVRAWGCDLSKKYVDINTEYN